MTSDPTTNQCTTDKENNLRSLDDAIASLERAIGYQTKEIGYHTKELKIAQDKLKELQKVRKLVTPEMEAALAALRSVNIL